MNPNSVSPMEPFDLADPKIDPSAFVAPTATILGDVTIGPRAVVLFGAVVRAEPDQIVVGEETNLQDQVVVHCDEGMPCHIGHRVTVGHGAVVHGALVGDHCLVGIGARLLNNSTLGEGAWLAAGSVLTEGSSDPALDAWRWEPRPAHCESYDPTRSNGNAMASNGTWPSASPIKGSTKAGLPIRPASRRLTAEAADGTNLGVSRPRASA